MATTTTEYARLTEQEWQKAKASQNAWDVLHHANAATAHARAATRHAHDDDQLLIADEAREKAAEALQRAAMMVRFGRMGRELKETA